MSVRLFINGNESIITSVDELRQALLPFASQQFREIWVNIDDGRSLSALLNANVGWLMYLRYPGDAGFSSRNPKWEGDDSEVIGYRLSNGEEDIYPANWGLSEQDVIRAVEYFVRFGRCPPFVEWHDDSQ